MKSVALHEKWELVPIDNLDEKWNQVSMNDDTCTKKIIFCE